jgi:hypothetical protein
VSDLGRRVPTDWTHVDKYPLAALPPEEVPVRQGVILGVNWYEAFDSPQDVGPFYSSRSFIGTESDWGSVRGGHAIFLPALGSSDTRAWWKFYDQNDDTWPDYKPGACTAFSLCRLQSHNNRKRYNPYPIYLRSQVVDDFDGSDYEGTSVRAAFDVVRQLGLPMANRDRGSMNFSTKEGITANRWLTSVEEIRTVTGRFEGAFPLLQSWGTWYPRRVWIPEEALARLLAEDGECVTSTDR